MARLEDAVALETLGRQLWDERRLLEAADAYDVAADIREELDPLPPAFTNRTRIASDRGASRRLRVTAWALAQWPGRIASDRAINPESLRRSKSTRSLFSVRLTTPDLAMHLWPLHLVAIDRRGRVGFATEGEIDRWRPRAHPFSAAVDRALAERPPIRRRAQRRR